MTVKLSELRVSSDFDASKYAAGMAEKVAADQSGTASSVKLGAAAGSTYEKIGRGGDVLERLSRQYVAGYGATSKFEAALRSLGRGIETGAVPMDRAYSILNGLYQKFGMTAQAADVASVGFIGLAKVVADYTTKANAATAAAERLNNAQQASARAAASPTSATAINQRLNVLPGAPDTSASRAADIAAYGKSLDDLRAKYAPLYAIERQYNAQVAEINNAHKVGAISSTEMTRALALAEHEFRSQSTAARLSGEAIAATGKSAALSSYALTNLSFQLNDVATQAALGQSPLRILAAQGGQFYQILQQGEGGVGASLAYIGRLIVGLITPFRLATAGALTLVTVAAAAGVAWSSAQSRISLSLIGVAQQAGVTAQAINRISLEVSRTGDLSVSEARDMALALASTGKVSEEIVEKAVRSGKALSLVFGTDAAGAAQIYAKALADPAKGVDELNARLGIFSDATSQTVKSLGTQNRVLEAQRILVDGTSKAIASAQGETTAWAQAWDYVANKASNWFNRLGEGTARIAGFQTQIDKLAQAKEEYDRKVDIGNQDAALFGEWTRQFNAGGLEDARKKVQDLEKSIDDLNETQKRAQQQTFVTTESKRIADLARTLDPYLSDLQTARDQLRDFEKTSSLPGIASAMSQTAIEQVAHVRDLLAAKVQLGERYLDLSYRTFGVESQRLGQAKEDYDLALKSLSAHTNAERAAAAANEAIANARRGGATAPEAQINGQLAGQQRLNDLLEQQSEALRDRQYQAKQTIAQGNIENSLTGRSIEVTTRLNAEFQLLSAAKQEAFKRRDVDEFGNGIVSATEKMQALANAQELARQAGQRARDGINNEVAFSVAQLGRTPIDQSVYSRMQSAGLLDNGKIVGAANEATAATIRLNEQMLRATETQKEFASTFLHSMLEGKSATEALGSALDQLASKILDNSIDALFAGLSSLGARSGSGSVVGNILAGIFHEGGVVGGSSATRSVSPAVFAGAPRYHGGGVAGLKPDEVPAILQRGEVVLPRGKSAGGGITVQIHTSIDATGAYPESIEDIKAALARRDAQMPGLVARQVRDMRDRALL